MQKARRHPNKLKLRPLVSTRFQVLLTRLLGVLFTFPSRYWFTIGHSAYLALADGAARFRQDFTGPALLRIPASPSRFAYGAITRFGRPSHAVLLSFVSLRRSFNPKGACTPGLGFSPFARHYLGNHCCSLFLPLLRCFSSQRLPSRLPGNVQTRLDGLPHSDTCGSTLLSSSPQLFAAWHVLHRP
jgi:hypothetical protein